MLDVETNSSKELQISKSRLDKLQSNLDALLDSIERDIDQDQKLSKDTFKELKNLVKKLPYLKRNMLRNTEKINPYRATQLKEKKELKISILS